MEEKPNKFAGEPSALTGISLVETLLQHFRNLKPAHFSLACLCMMWVFPFLYYVHTYPITTFYQEWWAAFLGMCAITWLLLPRLWVQPELPRVALLPIGLMLLVAVQYALGQLPYFDQAWLYILYLIWASLLIALGYHLRIEFGLPTLVTVLAICLLLGSEISALIGVLQHYTWHTFLDSVVAVKSTAAVFGNLGQPNHYANYITLGLVSLGLLHMHWKMRAWQVALLALPLLFVLALSGSRSAALYLFGMMVLAFFHYRRDKSALPLLQYSAMLIVGFGLMHLLLQIPALGSTEGTVTTMQRLAGEDTGGVKARHFFEQLRFYLWYEGWLIFTQFPWLGAGFGQYDWEHHLLTERLHDVNIAGLYNNAHNLVIQIAAETGLAGLLVLLTTLVMWLIQATRTRERNIYHWWAYSVLAVLGIHSLLEYPLWYAYFLGVTAFLLGMMDHTAYRWRFPKFGRILTVAMLALGLLSLLQIWQGNRKMEGILASYPPVTKNLEPYYQRMRERLLAISRMPLMTSAAELYMTKYQEISPENIEEKIASNDRAMRASPQSLGLYSQAIFLALDGQQAAAELQMSRAIWSHPGKFKFHYTRLQYLARKDPEHYSALLEFSAKEFKTYKERQHAIRNR